MAIINQERTVTRTITERRATTIADAVRINPTNDYWSNDLAEGALKDAMIANKIAGAAGQSICERNRMMMCTSGIHRRLFQAGF